MRINSLKEDRKPLLMIIPMIDIIFFLLVFFMMSMLTMVTQKTIALNLPKAAIAKVDTTSPRVDHRGRASFPRAEFGFRGGVSSTACVFKD